MSKRTNLSSDSNPTKRARRPAGFRAARPPSAPTPASTASGSASTLPSLNTSVFVTVRQPEEPRGALKRHTRVLEAEITAQQEHSGLAEIEQDELPFPSGMEPDGEDGSSFQSKWTRHTKNAVSDIEFMFQSSY